MNRIVLPTVIALAAVSCVSSDQLRRQEYDHRYKQAVQLCGQPDAAFQAGYNTGYGDPYGYGNGYYRTAGYGGGYYGGGYYGRRSGVPRFNGHPIASW